MNRIALVSQRLMLFASLMLVGCASDVVRGDREALRQQVIETERAFAQSMVRRDFAAFAALVDEEAVFLSDNGPARGKQAVLDRWRKLFEKPQAPFSWAPGQVEVLDSGNLALSTGPVYDAKGKRVATFTSVWRLEAPDRWRIIFDKGDDACDGQ